MCIEEALVVYCLLEEDDERVGGAGDERILKWPSLAFWLGDEPHFLDQLPSPLYGNELVYVFWDMQLLLRHRRGAIINSCCLFRTQLSEVARSK